MCGLVGLGSLQSKGLDMLKSKLVSDQGSARDRNRHAPLSSWRWPSAVIVALLSIGLATVTVTPAVAASGPASFAYVSNASGDSVSVINTSTNTVVATIPVGEE